MFVLTGKFWCSREGYSSVKNYLLNSLFLPKAKDFLVYFIKDSISFLFKISHVINNINNLITVN